jgi:hypothetical protein
VACDESECCVFIAFHVGSLLIVFNQREWNLLFLNHLIRSHEIIILAIRIVYLLGWRSCSQERLVYIGAHQQGDDGVLYIRNACYH